MSRTLAKIPLNLPNGLTLSRVFLIAPLLWLLEAQLFFGAYVLASWVFLTDFLDGRLARANGQTTFAGAILDPVADKLVALSLFSYLFVLHRVEPWYYALIVVRDVAQLASIPILIGWRRILFKVAPKRIPKWGTALNFTLLGVLFVQLHTDAAGFDLSYAWILLPLYLISGVIEVYILVTYLPRFRQIYLGQHDTFE
jgi:cardiolipin synthase